MEKEMSNLSVPREGNLSSELTEKITTSVEAEKEEFRNKVNGFINNFGMLKESKVEKGIKQLITDDNKDLCLSVLREMLTSEPKLEELEFVKKEKEKVINNIIASVENKGIYAKQQ